MTSLSGATSSKLTLYAFVPACDLSQIIHQPHNIALDQDYKAWYDLMVRLNHMFRLGLDLSDLQQRSEAMIEAIRKNIDELSEKLPNVPLKEYLARLTADFVEKPFTKLDEVWEHALEDVLKDLE